MIGSHLKEEQFFQQCTSSVEQHIAYVKSLENEGKLSIISKVPSIKYVFTLCRRYGLLMRDGIHLATLMGKHLSDIATADTDFEKILSLTVWSPEL